MINAVRAAVEPEFPVAIKLNATDQLEGGFAEDESLDAVAAVDRTEIDLIDVSGGTYFPDAASSSDRVGSGPYFIGFCGTRPQKDEHSSDGFGRFQNARSRRKCNC